MQRFLNGNTIGQSESAVNVPYFYRPGIFNLSDSYNNINNNTWITTLCAENYVTNGLIFYIDPARQDCYPGYGNNINDLSNYKNKGIMIGGTEGGPTYDSIVIENNSIIPANSGYSSYERYFVLNGNCFIYFPSLSSTYIAHPRNINLSAFSISVWINLNPKYGFDLRYKSISEFIDFSWPLLALSSNPLSAKNNYTDWESNQPKLIDNNGGPRLEVYGTITDSTAVSYNKTPPTPGNPYYYPPASISWTLNRGVYSSWYQSVSYEQLFNVQYSTTNTSIIHPNASSIVSYLSSVWQQPYYQYIEGKKDYFSRPYVWNVINANAYNSGIASNYWYNLVLVRDSSNPVLSTPALYSYCNGQFVGSCFSPLLTSVFTGLMFGTGYTNSIVTNYAPGSYYGPNFYNTLTAGGPYNYIGPSRFVGKLGPVQIWNRPLSATEIAQNYNAFAYRYNLPTVNNPAIQGYAIGANPALSAHKHSFYQWTFEGSGSLVVTQSGYADILIVGGGGAGGYVGGGGAGGVIYKTLLLNTGTYNVVVGAGGGVSQWFGQPTGPGNGSNSLFYPISTVNASVSALTAFGGGAGGGGNDTLAAGMDGGSGGGGSGNHSGGNGVAGQGFQGGGGADLNTGGGGGGAGNTAGGIGNARGNGASGTQYTLYDPSGNPYTVWVGHGGTGGQGLLVNTVLLSSYYVGAGGGGYTYDQNNISGDNASVGNSFPGAGNGVNGGIYGGGIYGGGGGGAGAGSGYNGNNGVVVIWTK